MTKFTDLHSKIRSFVSDPCSQSEKSSHASSEIEFSIQAASCAVAITHERQIICMCVWVWVWVWGGVSVF